MGVVQSIKTALGGKPDIEAARAALSKAIDAFEAAPTDAAKARVDKARADLEFAELRARRAAEREAEARAKRAADERAAKERELATAIEQAEIYGEALTPIAQAFDEVMAAFLAKVNTPLNDLLRRQHAARDRATQLARELGRDDEVAHLQPGTTSAGDTWTSIVNRMQRLSRWSEHTLEERMALADVANRSVRL